MRRHGVQTWLRYGLAAGYTSVSLSFVWVIVAVFTLDRGMPPPAQMVVLAYVSVVVYGILRTTERFIAAFELAEDDRFTRSAPAVSWRLLDPVLSTFGLWRAEVAAHPSEIDGFRNRKMVNEYVRRLVRDWSIKMLGLVASCAYHG